MNASSGDDGSTIVLTTRSKRVYHTSKECQYAKRARTLSETFTRELAEQWGRTHCRECARLEADGDEVGQ